MSIMNNIIEKVNKRQIGILFAVLLALLMVAVPLSAVDAETSVDITVTVKIGNEINTAFENEIQLKGISGTKNASVTAGVSETITDVAPGDYEVFDVSTVPGMKIGSIEVTMATNYDIVAHNITYTDTVGITESELDITKFYEGIQTTLSTPGEVTGYTFGGWYTEQELNNEVTEVPTNTKADYVVYAKWTLDTPTISGISEGYNGNYDGADHNLTVSATAPTTDGTSSALSALEYKWYTVDGNGNKTLINTESNASANTATLVLKNVTDSNKYCVEVISKNSANDKLTRSAFSGNVDVTINAVKLDVTINAWAQGSVSWSCTGADITGITTTYELKLYKGSADLANIKFEGSTKETSWNFKDTMELNGDGDYILTITAKSSDTANVSDSDLETSAAETVYKLTFNSNKDGVTVNPIYAVKGSTVEAPAPTTAGNQLLGWFTDNSLFQNEYNFKTPIAGSDELFAKWQTSSTSVTFEKTVVTQEGITVNYGATPTLKTQVKEGYTCAGYVVKGTSTVLFSNEGVLQSNVSDYTDSDGKWICNEASLVLVVSWAINAPDFTPSFTDVDFDGVAQVINSNVIVPEGVTAKYQWYKGTSNSGTKIVGGDGATYSITNVADSGDYFVEVIFEDADLAEPTAAVGKTIKATISQVTLSSPTELEWDTTIGTAEWTASTAITGIDITYIVKVYKDSGAGVIYTSEPQVGTTLDLSTVLVEKGKGTYTFTVQAISGASGNAADSAETDKSGSLAVHEVTFDMQDHGDGKRPAYVINGDTYESPKQDDVTGYTFGGWFDDAECTGSAHDFQAAVEDDVALFAKWTVNTHIIKFDNNGGSGSELMADLSINYDETKELTPNAFTNDGNTFLGWATSAEGDVVYKDGVAYVMKTDNNVTLYAVWGANVTTEPTVTIHNEFDFISKDFTGFGGEVTGATGTVYVSYTKAEINAETKLMRYSTSGATEGMDDLVVVNVEDKWSVDTEVKGIIKAYAYFEYQDGDKLAHVVSSEIPVTSVTKTFDLEYVGDSQIQNENAEAINVENVKLKNGEDFKFKLAVSDNGESIKSVSYKVGSMVKTLSESGGVYTIPGNVVKGDVTITVEENPKLASVE